MRTVDGFTVSRHPPSTVEYYDGRRMAGLRATLEPSLLSWPGVTSRTTFGCPSYLVDGTLFAFLVTDGVVVTRLDDGEVRQALTAGGATPFTAGRRVVSSWPRLPLDGRHVDPALGWIQASYERARDHRAAEPVPLR